MIASSSNYTSSNESENILNYFISDIRVRAMQGETIDDIREWIKTKGYSITKMDLRHFMNGNNIKIHEGIVKTVESVQEEIMKERDSIVKEKENTPQTPPKEKEIILTPLKQKELDILEAMKSDPKIKSTHYYFIDKISVLFPAIKQYLETHNNNPVTVRKLFDETEDITKEKISVYQNAMLYMVQAGFLRYGDKKGNAFTYYLPELSLDEVKREYDKIKNAAVRREPTPKEVIDDTSQIHVSIPQEELQKLKDTNEGLVKDNKELEAENESIKEALKKHRRRINQLKLKLEERYKETKIQEKDLNTSDYRFYSTIIAKSNKVIIENREGLTFEIDCKDLDSLMHVYQQAKILNFDVKIFADSRTGKFKLTAMEAEQ